MITYLIIAYGLVSATWLLYVAIMHLRIVRDREGLTVPQKVMGYPLLITGLVFDTILNWVVVSVLLLSPPREFLTTARFKKVPPRQYMARQPGSMVVPAFSRAV